MTPLAILGSVFFGSLLGGLLPFINTELIVLTAAAAAPVALLIPVVLIAAITQMAAKTVLYHAGAGVLRLPACMRHPRFESALAKAQRFQHGSSALLFVSASTGFPPFYVVSIASGALHFRFRRFLVLGFLGRLVRFGALILTPYLIRTSIN